MSNSEQVTGPGNGLISLVLVLLLCVLATAGIWTLHKHRYVNPLETVTQDGSSKTTTPAEAH